jgi:hypothetical protein
MNVGSLSVLLGLQMDQSWSKGEKGIRGIRRAGSDLGAHFNRVGAVVAGVFGAKIIGKALLGFNANVEDSKNNIAAMLALGSQSPLASQLGNASKLYDMLRLKAQTLPGETQDYVNMLGLLAQPLSRAQVSLEAMRDITAGSFVMAKGMGISWQEASRDLRDFINQGKRTTKDKFLLGMLEGTGLDATDEGRAKAKKLGNKGRAELVQKQTTGKLAQDMAALLGSSFSGRLETVKDNIKMAFGKIGEGLFAKVKVSLDKLATWFTQNQGTIAAWGEKIGNIVGGVFDVVQTAVMWLLDHQDVLMSFFVGLSAMLLVMMANALMAWMGVAWPMFAGAGLFLMFTKLFKVLGPLGSVLIAIGVAAAMMWLGIGGPLVIAIVAIAMFAAALYVWKDEVLAIFDSVVEAAKTVVGWFDKVFGFGGGSFDDVFAQVRAGEAGADGASGLPGTAAWRSDPVRDDEATSAGGSNLGGIVVNSPTTLNITTADAAGAKEAFNKVDQDRQDAAQRAAFRAAGGTL